MKRGKGSVRGDLGGEGVAAWRVGDRERTGSGRYNVSRLRNRKGCGPPQGKYGTEQGYTISLSGNICF